MKHEWKTPDNRKVGVWSHDLGAINANATHHDALTEILRLAERVRELEEQARLDNLCDVCAGTGKPTSGWPCACGGTGSMRETVAHLRVVALVDQPARIAALEEDNAKLRALWETVEAEPLLRRVRALKEELSVARKGWGEEVVQHMNEAREKAKVEERLARLDALLESEEPPKEFTDALLKGTLHWTPAGARTAWRWFREQLKA